MQDDVKVITLQAKNASNQDIYNIFNNKQIILSKDYGLTRTYDMVTFPTDTTPLLLIGKARLLSGYRTFRSRKHLIIMQVMNFIPLIMKVVPWEGVLKKQ